MTSLSETSMLAGSSGATSGYEINQSLRFEDGTEHILHRRVDTTWQDKFTISFWVKRNNISLYNYIITWRSKQGNGYPFGEIKFTNGDQLEYFDYGTSIDSNYPIYAKTNRLFRDTSAWYHIVMAVDYSGYSAGEQGRFRMFVNGVQETDFATMTLANQAAQSGASGAAANYIQIGRLYDNSNYNAESYLAEFNFIDGYAYGPEYFGEFKEDTDIWIPKQYTDGYSNQSFYLSFADSSDIGNDDSGNGKDFTAVGLAASDVVPDSPTNNFNTLNPHNPNSHGTFSQGNLTVVLSGDDQFSSTQELLYKSYCEVRLDASSNYGGAIGFGTQLGDNDQKETLTFSVAYNSGQINTFTSTDGNVGGTISVGDIVMMAYDPATRKWWVGVNGTWRNSGDPAGGTGQVYQHGTDYFTESKLGAIVWGGWKGAANGMTTTWNFGQDSTFGGQETAGSNSDSNGIGNFKYSVPNGFLANCTSNLGAS